jgi:hypothetical protein
MPQVSGTISTTPTAAMIPIFNASAQVDIVLYNIIGNFIIGVQQSLGGGVTWSSVTDPATGAPIVVGSHKPQATAPIQSALNQFRLSGHPTATPNFRISAMAEQPQWGSK